MPSLDSYYQPDFSHRNNKPKPQPSVAPQYEIGLDGVPTRTSGNPVSPTGGIMGGLPTDYKATEASAFASTARHRGEMADIRGGGGDTSSGRKPLPRQILPSTEVRKNSNGVVSTGKKLSGGVSAAFVPEFANSSFNDLFKAINGREYQPFSSEQLPTTASNPYSATPPKTIGFDEPAPGVKGNSIADFGGDESAAFAQSRERTANDTFNPDAARIEGGSSRKPGGSLDEALADTAGINSYMKKFSSGAQERAANRAFLDGKDSMAGLRAKEAVNGVVYAGGKHYVSGESADSPALEINRSQARDISNGKSSAQSLLQAHIDKNKNASTPAEAQEPMTIDKPGVKQSFGRTETISAPIDTSIPDTKAFEINNDNFAPSFGNTGGYKSTSKKPTVDYSKIFS